MFKVLATSILLLGSAAVHAVPIYSYSTDNFGQSVLSASPSGGVNPNGGEVLTLDTTYSSATGDFTWDYTAAVGGGGNHTDGFWLVVSDGPGPKYNTGEYAILYGDTQNNQVTAYEYNGVNNNGSYSNAGALLDVFPNSINSSTDTSGITSVSLSINVNDINNSFSTTDWKGVQFADQIGIWFHPTANSNFSYLTNGTNGIQSYSGQAGWYDTRGSLTTDVPEPGMLALLGIGAIGFLRRKKPAITG